MASDILVLRLLSQSNTDKSSLQSLKKDQIWIKAFLKMPCNSVAEYGYSFSETVLFASIFSPYRYRVTVKKKRLNTTNKKRGKKSGKAFDSRLELGAFCCFWSQATCSCQNSILLNASLKFPKEEGTRNALFKNAFAYRYLIC